MWESKASFDFCVYLDPDPYRRIFGGAGCRASIDIVASAAVFTSVDQLIFID